MPPKQPLNDYSGTCLICEVRIMRIARVTNSTNPSRVLTEHEWKHHRQKPLTEHLFVPSSEVENTEFTKYPWLSSCYIRAGKLHLQLKRTITGRV